MIIANSLYLRHLHRGTSLLFLMFIFIVITPTLMAREKIIFIDRKDDKKYFKTILHTFENKKLCLISNQAGSGKYLFVPSQKGFPSYYHEILAAKNITLHKIFSPEHGLSSQSESNGLDTDAMLVGNLQVLAAYHKTSQELKIMFGGCEVILFDLPDSGVRPYTYRTILTRSLQAVESLGGEAKFILIDQENPASIYRSSGPFVRENYFSYLGEQSMPFFPAYTYAELTRYYLQMNKMNLNIRYIALPHYRPGSISHGHIQPPSPSLPHIRALQCYWVGIFFEGTTLDYGKFSKDPFCLIGHPQLDYRNDPPEIDGVTWSKYLYKPFGGPYQNMLLRGYKMEINDVSRLDPSQVAYKVLGYILENYPQIQLFSFGTNMYTFDKIVGGNGMRESLLNHISYDSWKMKEDSLINQFEKQMYNFRLY